LSGYKTIPYIHIQDIENYHDPGLRAKFFRIIDEIREATEKYGIEYQLGYSNSQTSQLVESQQNQ
jgi:hypothetical protein